MKIPAKPQVGNRAAKKQVKKLRVAAYCRVSTDTEEQATSYEAQIQLSANRNGNLSTSMPMRASVRPIPKSVMNSIG